MSKPDTQILNTILIFKKGSGLMLDWLGAKAMSYHVGGSVPGTQGLCLSCWNYPWWLELLLPCYEWMHIINSWQHCVSQGNAGSSTQERGTWALQGQWLCSGAQEQKRAMKKVRPSLHQMHQTFPNRQQCHSRDGSSGRETRKIPCYVGGILSGLGKAKTQKRY